MRDSMELIRPRPSSQPRPESVRSTVTVPDGVRKANGRPIEYLRDWIQYWCRKNFPGYHRVQ